MSITKFPTVEKCTSIDREKDIIVTDLDGTLLRGGSSFAYFAFTIRWNVLLFHLESVGIQVIIFVTFVGMRVSDIEWVARTVLQKFYLEDLHPESWRVFSPRILVEPFLKECLGTRYRLRTEIETYKGRATGFVRSPGVLVGKNKANALASIFGETQPEIGLGDRDTDIPFMILCKESYYVPSKPKVKAVTSDKLLKPIIFHDGRLVIKPTPLRALFIILWIPFGFLLSCVRFTVGLLLPTSLRTMHFGSLVSKSQDQSSVLFVCCHRTPLDAIFLSTALGRPIPAVTYSFSPLLKIFSPIKTIRLTQDRAYDAYMIKQLLKEGDLAIFPEGTTNREPFLLRFSSLCAEVTDELVPVAIENKMSMFHGTTTRGWKWMDLSHEFTCDCGKSSNEVANYIQKVIAETLSYDCTTFTWKDKYLSRRK
ncbi:unnamed protein product [Withania somnifera]